MAEPKQRKVAQILLEDTGTSVGQAMRDVGYSKGYAKNPQDLIKTKSFQQILEEAGVSDEKLSKVLDEGLDAKNKDGADYSVRHKYLETAIKVKGHIKDSEPTGNTYNTFIQQNNLNPNAPEARELVDSTLEMLMSKTKRNEKS